MRTTKSDIRQWLKSAKKEKASHMLVVCDKFDYEDYPVSVKRADQLNQQIIEHSKNMQKVMEVYDLKANLEQQLNQPRAGLNLVTDALSKTF